MKLTTLLLLVLFSFQGQAQDKAELVRRNGFKDLKLGSPIDSVKGAEFKKDIKEKNEFPAKLYTVESRKWNIRTELPSSWLRSNKLILWNGVAVPPSTPLKSGLIFFFYIFFEFRPLHTINGATQLQVLEAISPH